MELRWLVDPTTRKRVLQYRSRGDNGVYGPGYECHDTGWTEVPEVYDPRFSLKDDSEDISYLPTNCRERLRLEGRAYPKSGCAVCGDGGLHGCRHKLS